MLDATFELAAEGGFDAVQMRDVAAAADVALGTVYRYFSSKERLLLEAMAEQQADLRAYLETHPLAEATAAERVCRCCGARTGSLRALPRRDRGDGALVRLRADRERRHRAARHRDHDRDHHPRDPGRANATRRPTREVRVARILMQVWLSSLNGWVCGVDGPDRVDEDLDAAARLLLG